MALANEVLTVTVRFDGGEMADPLASIRDDLALLGQQLDTERETRMTENLTTREALDTLNKKLDDALNRNQAQVVAFGTFAKNVMHTLDGLAKQADDPTVPALTAGDLAEIRQMMTTADSIGLTGLADFGVTPTGDRLPASPPAPAPGAVPPADSAPVPASEVQTADGQPVQTADGQPVVAVPVVAPSADAAAEPPAPQEDQAALPLAAPTAAAAPPAAEDADVGAA